MYAIKSTHDVRNAITALHSRFDAKHEEWRLLDPWRTMDVPMLANQVWEGLPPTARRATIAKTDIASITDTTVSFLIGDDPVYTTVPADTRSIRGLDNANEVERFAKAFIQKCDEHRPFPLVHQGAEYVTHRGHLVTRRLWLSPEQRKERRESVVNVLGQLVPGLQEPTERVTGEGRFPLDIQHLDPADCFWTLDETGEAVEFYHEYQTSYAAAEIMFPELRTHPQFSSFRTSSGYQTQLTVQDYWNDERNCVLINDIEIKPPSLHHYTVFPFVIDMAKPVLDQSDGNPAWWGTPFCAPILTHVVRASWADSIIQPYLEIIAYATLQHKGISSRPNGSPYMGVDPESGKSVYLGVADHGPAAPVLPGFDQESWEYLRPPEIVQVLQEFKAQRIRDIQLLTYAESILTGVYQVGPLSGLSVSQQKVAAMQRLVPRAECMNRHYSRVYTGAVQMARDEWDRGGQAILVNLTGKGSNLSVEITPELLDSVAGITVTMRPKIPVNEQAERQVLREDMQLNIRSLRNVQETIGIEDPAWEFRQRAFEIASFSNPQFLNAIAWEHGVAEGIIQRANPYLPPEYAGQEPPAAPGQALPTPGIPAPQAGGPQAGSPLPASAQMPPAAQGPGMVASGPPGGMGQGQMPMEPGMQEMALQQIMNDPRLAAMVNSLGGGQ